jgi:hypothetical protein
MAILLDFDKVLKILRFFRSEARWQESGTYAA